MPVVTHRSRDVRHCFTGSSSQRDSPPPPPGPSAPPSPPRSSLSPGSAVLKRSRSDAYTATPQFGSTGKKLSIGTAHFVEVPSIIVCQFVPVESLKIGFNPILHNLQSVFSLFISVLPLSRKLGSVSARIRPRRRRVRHIIVKAHAVRVSNRIPAAKPPQLCRVNAGPNLVPRAWQGAKSVSYDVYSPCFLGFFRWPGIAAFTSVPARSQLPVQSHRASLHPPNHL